MSRMSRSRWWVALRSSWRTRKRWRLAAQDRVRIEIAANTVPGFRSPGLRRKVAVIAAVSLAAAAIAEASLPAVGVGVPQPLPEGAEPLDRFLPLAVTVLASLLGFYLASAAIVLHQTYAGVPWHVRQLVFTNQRTQLFLVMLVASIVVGLTLIVLRDTGTTLGLLASVLYLVLVGYGAWAFYRLIRDTFRAHDPSVLADQPLRNLFVFVDGLDAQRPVPSTARQRVQDAHGELDCLDAIVAAAQTTTPVPLDELAQVAVILNSMATMYAPRRHALAPLDESLPGVTLYVSADSPSPNVLATLEPLRIAEATWFAHRAAALSARVLASPMGNAPAYDLPQIAGLSGGAGDSVRVPRRYCRRPRHR